MAILVTEPTFNRDKFKELIVYIASKCDKDRLWNATKLNKILFRSDFAAYKRLGRAITGADYFALPQGPAPRALVPIRGEMVTSGDIDLKINRQHRVHAKRQPNMSKFSTDEVAIVDESIEFFRNEDSDGASDITHRFLGWKAAIAEGIKTSIPYGTVFFENPPLGEDEKAYGLELAKQYKWAI